MKKVRCPGCGKSFKTPQALGNHQNWCRRLKGLAPAAPAPRAAVPTPSVPTPSAESYPRRKKSWDPSWSDAEKERRIMEALPFDWGVAKGRGGKWQVVPVPGGMEYSAAVSAADERNTLDLLFPPVRRRRVREEENTEEALSALLMLELLNR